MSLFTSSHFASAVASGQDWREASKNVLDQFSDLDIKGQGFNLGFLYVSDLLVDDAESILNLFKSVLGIEDWVGGVAVAICGTGETFLDKPAISVMIGAFDEGDFCLFPALDKDFDVHSIPLGAWLEKTQPMFAFVHGDPLAQQDPVPVLRALADGANMFPVGGLTSARGQQLQFSGKVCEGGVSGVVFSSDVPVVTALSQGCHAIGSAHAITRHDEQTILELDSKKAVSVFEDDLRNMVMKKIERDPDEIVIDEDDIPDEFKFLFKGEVHAALPVSESDQKDYLVRNIITIDQDEGSITIGEQISNGDRILFVHRNDDTIGSDLSKSLVALRERVQREQGCFEPKGALYVSCVARVSETVDDELQLIREIIGDVPLAGFYAGGEISNARLYGYTGVLTLFL